jgi:hypothetical protein
VWLSSNYEDNTEKTEETLIELLSDKAVEENMSLEYQEFNRLLKKLRSLSEGISIISRIILTREDLKTQTQTGRTATFCHHKGNMEWSGFESRPPQCKAGD